VRDSIRLDGSKRTNPDATPEQLKNGKEPTRFHVQGTFFHTGKGGRAIGTGELAFFRCYQHQYNIFLSLLGFPFLFFYGDNTVRAWDKSN
jgi:hypothetical protein